VGDTTDDAGQIVGPGANGVLISGPTFSLPSVITIEGDETYRSKVLRDLYFISTTKSGQELFARLERAGQRIIIQPPPVDPMNINTTPTDLSTYRAGTPCGVTMQWNPDTQTISEGSTGGIFSISPQEGLMHEAVHALAYAEGNMPTREKDDAAWPNRLDETHAIGTGTFQEAFPTENSFRDDLGLYPPRVQQDPVDVTNKTQLPLPQNFRPGKL
jgi:hypothetical protein